MRLFPALFPFARTVERSGTAEDILNQRPVPDVGAIMPSPSSVPVPVSSKR